MTRPLFLTDAAEPLPGVGHTVRLGGAEGRHAAVVRRIRAGEQIMVGDGAGSAIAGEVVAADRDGVDVRVDEVCAPRAAGPRIVVAQALAKGDRSDLSVEMLTEVGATEIIAWQAQRSIVKWVGERAKKSLSKWQSTAREATKQSRRFTIPAVTGPVSSAQVTERIRAAALALVLHEDADADLGTVRLPDGGEVVVVVGPEGGISSDEVARFVAAGAVCVRISDAVLRTSTAGAVAVGALRMRGWDRCGS